MRNHTDRRFAAELKETSAIKMPQHAAYIKMKEGSTVSHKVAFKKDSQRPIVRWHAEKGKWR